MEDFHVFHFTTGRGVGGMSLLSVVKVENFPYAWVYEILLQSPLLFWSNLLADFPAQNLREPGYAD
jgi:hypothetical protein